MDAVCLTRLLSYPVLAAQDILALRHYFKMVRIYTRPIATEMV